MSTESTVPVFWCDTVDGTFHVQGTTWSNAYLAAGVAVTAFFTMLRSHTQLSDLRMAECDVAFARLEVAELRMAVYQRECQVEESRAVMKAICGDNDE